MNKKRAKIDNNNHKLMSHQLDAKEEMIFSSGEFSFSSHDVLRLMLRTL